MANFGPKTKVTLQTIADDAVELARFYSYMDYHAAVSNAVYTASYCISLFCLRKERFMQFVADNPDLYKVKIDRVDDGATLPDVAWEVLRTYLIRHIHGAYPKHSYQQVVKPHGNHILKIEKAYLGQITGY